MALPLPYRETSSCCQVTSLMLLLSVGLTTCKLTTSCRAVHLLVSSCTVYEFEFDIFEITLESSPDNKILLPVQICILVPSRQRLGGLHTAYNDSMRDLDFCEKMPAPFCSSVRFFERTSRRSYSTRWHR